MTRSSPFPRRFSKPKSVSHSGHSNLIHADSTHCPTTGYKSESKRIFFFISGSKARKKPTKHETQNTIFLGAYDNLLERNGNACNNRNVTTHMGSFRGSTSRIIFFLKRGRNVTETERGGETLPRHQILLCNPPRHTGWTRQLSRCESSRSPDTDTKGEKKYSTGYSITFNHKTRKKEKI